MPNGIDFSVDDPDQQDQLIQPPFQGPPSPAPVGIQGISPDIHGTPGIGVIGPQRFRVGIQAPQTVAQYNAWQASMPGPRTVQEANLIANQAAQEANFQRQLMQSAKVEDAAKAIAASRRYIATRKLGRDVQAALASGLPYEQAWAHAAANNLEAFGGNLAPVTSAMRYATPHEGAVWHPPEGNRPGYFSTPQGTVHLATTPKTGLDVSTRQEVQWHNNAIKAAQDEISDIKKYNVAWEKTPEFKTRIDELEKSIESEKTAIRNKLGGVAPAESGAPAPQARTQADIDKAITLANKALSAIRGRPDYNQRAAAIMQRLKDMKIDVEMQMPTSPAATPTTAPVAPFGTPPSPIGLPAIFAPHAGALPAYG